MPRRNSNKMKALRGTSRADRIKPCPFTAPVVPDPDTGLDSVAQAEWHRITKAMAEGGLITSLDAAVLAGYCVNLSRWKRAEASLARDGEVISVDIRDTHQNVTGHKLTKNPMLAVSESAQRLMSRFADQLGLSPAARTKQGYDHTKKDDESDEWKQFTQEFEG